MLYFKSMRTDREKARELRLSGKSYREIRSVMNIPISTLSEWFKNDPESQKIFDVLKEKYKSISRDKLKVMYKARLENIELKDKSIEKTAREEYVLLRNSPLFISALSLYWGEGDKMSKYQSRLSNIDPKLIRVYFRFLTEICHLPANRIKSWLLLYPDLNETESKKYWISNACLPAQNFTKSIVIKGKHKSKRLSFGVCNTGVGGRAFKKKLLIWIDLLAKELGNAGMV